MIDATLESNSANGPVVVFDFKNDHEELIQVNETTPYRIAIETDSNDVAVFLGSLQLTEYRVGSTVYFSLDFEQLDDARNCNFFGNLFNNLIGYSKFDFEIGDEHTSFKVLIESEKTNEEEIQAWMDSISKAFPIYYSPKSLSPLSYLPARIEHQTNFSSLFSILEETEEIIENVSRRCKGTGYLKRRYNRQVQDTGGNEIFDYSKPYNWFSENRKWGPSSLKNYGQVQIKFAYFEPHNLPKTIGVQSYDTDLNRLLMSSINSLRASLEIYKKSIIENMGELLKLRTQFRNQQSKGRIGLRFEEVIERAIDKINILSALLSNYGVKTEISPTKIYGDRRYTDLISDISIISQLSVSYRKYAESGKEKLGILGLELIFEMFCYAELLECVQSYNFKIKDIDEPKSINQLITLWNNELGIGLRIFYDVPVPKNTEDTSGFPLVDYLQFGRNKRPDFLLHFYNDEYEHTAIIDAKYKSLDKCLKDFKRFNGDNLLVKYGTKFFAKSGFSLPPFFIGAICLKSDSDASCELTPVVSSGSDLLVEHPFQEAAIVELNSSDSSGLMHLFDHLLSKFMNYEHLAKNNSNLEIVEPNFELELVKRNLGNKKKFKMPKIQIIEKNTEK